MTTTQTAILGFAHGHLNAYCKLWNEHPEWGVTLTCGWDHDGDRLAEAVETFRLEPVTDAATLLSRDDVDAVVIGAETALHADLVEQAAAAGKAIVLQKPLALTMGEADRIVEAVQRHGVPFTMAWQMRVDPQNLKIRELLSDGVLGRVFQVRRRHGLSFLYAPHAADSWHTQARWNRDLWADDSSHPIDFIYWLFGLPETATAELTTLYKPETPMDNGIVIYRYPGGPLVEVACSFVTHAAENVTEITAEKGSLIQNYGDGPSCDAPRPADAIGLKWYLKEDNAWTDSGIPSPPGHRHRIQALAEPLAAFLRGERPPIATAEEGRDALRMVLATYVSSQSGQRIALSDPAIDTI